MKKPTTFLSLLVLLPTATTAFSPPQAAFPKTTARSAAASSSNDYYRRTLEQARQVAFAPTSSPEEARKYLFEVLHLQTGCSTGLLGDDDGEGVCDNVQEMADVVAHLRVKAEERGLRRETVLLASSVLSASAITLMAWLLGSSSNIVHAVPFTPEEWMWAIRDGYLPTLMEQNLKYGGFSVSDPSAALQPFLWEEWAWSIRDGYFPTMVADWFRNGGL